MKKIKFTADHVGLKVTHAELGKGEIFEFNDTEECPVTVAFPNGRNSCVCKFNTDGTRRDSPERVLFIGHNVEFKMVREGELPEPKTTCPVCGVLHEAVRPLYRVNYSFVISGNGQTVHPTCPFRNATFETKELAELAMANLIKFCEPATEEITIERHPNPFHGRVVEFWNQNHPNGPLVSLGDE